MAEQDQRLGFSSELDLEDRLTAADYLEKLWQTCSEMEQDVIRLFLYQAAQGLLTKKQWDRLTSQHQVRLTLGLTRLRRIGFILTVRKLWSEVGFVMPQEIREFLLSRLYSANLKEKTLVSIEPQALSYYTASGRGIHLDLFGLLLFVRDHETPLTQKNTIHRRVLQKLEHRFSLREEHVAGWFHTLFSPAIKESYQPETAVILDLALRMGLLRIEQNRLLLVAERVAEWMDLPPTIRWSREYQLMLDTYLPAEPWLEAFAITMKQEFGEQWVEIDQVLMQLRTMGYELPVDALSVLKEQWLHPLLGFGWIQLGEREDRCYWRWNAFLRVESADGWYVQPTGEMIVPPLVSLNKLWELGRLANISFDGEWIKATLDAQLVQQFMSQGSTWQEAVDFLQEGSAYPLPEEVAELLRRWSEKAKQIFLERLVRVRVAEPQLLDEMVQVPLLAPYLRERISPTDVILSVEAEKELTAALRRCGYDVILSGADLQKQPPAVLERNETSEDAGLFTDHRQLAGYRVENIFPETEEGLGSLQSLPKMWTRHYQTYHPQTMRDLCRRAMELGLEVRIERKNGEEWQGIPQRVEVEMGYWILTMESNRKRKSCRLEEIGRAQIVLPEYL